MLIFEQTESEKIDLLKQAIESKVEISFWYKGSGFRDPKNKRYKKMGWRYVEPTDIGKSKASGRLLLRAYQLSGTTNTKRPAWKTFLVDEMSNITLMTGKNSAYRPFKEPSGPNFNKNGDKKMVNDKPDLKIDLNKEPIANMGLAENKFSNWILNICYGK
jgi:hypothetical protein